MEDVNDNPPKFDEIIYRLKVLENEAIGYQLLKVHANDGDGNSNITYSLEDNLPKAIKKLVNLESDGN